MKFISANQNDSLAITMYIVTVAMNMSFLRKGLTVINYRYTLRKVKINNYFSQK